MHFNEIRDQAQEKFIKKSGSDEEDNRSFVNGDEDGKDEELP